MAVLRYPNWLWPDFPSALEDVERARRHMDRLLSAFTRSGGETPVVSGVFPPLTVSEDGDRIIVEAEIPGILPEDLNISVVGKTLTLSGEKKPDEAENACYHRGSVNGEASARR